MDRLFAAPRTLIALTMAMAIGTPKPVDSQTATAAAQGVTAEENFNRVCGACHTVGGGKLIGPDLRGVTERRSEQWLHAFIKSSQTMVKSGDTAAVALFDQYKIIMPDNPYTEVEIQGIIDLLGSGWTKVPVVADVAATPDQIRMGSELFQGTRRLSSGGPACSSCHHVSTDAVIGGGVLAKSLTQAYGRLGALGIRSILDAPPFPVMEQAYKPKPLSDDEKIALVGYLKNANANPPSYNQPRDDGLKLLFGGLGGMLVLVGLYAITWRRRKRYPVNRAVFDRQVRSQ